MRSATAKLTELEGQHLGNALLALGQLPHPGGAPCSAGGAAEELVPAAEVAAAGGALPLLPEHVSRPQLAAFKKEVERRLGWQDRRLAQALSTEALCHAVWGMAALQVGLQHGTLCMPCGSGCLSFSACCTYSGWVELEVGVHAQCFFMGAECLTFPDRNAPPGCAAALATGTLPLSALQECSEGFFAAALVELGRRGWNDEPEGYCQLLHASLLMQAWFTSQGEALASWWPCDWWLCLWVAALSALY